MIIISRKCIAVPGGIKRICDQLTKNKAIRYLFSTTSKQNPLEKYILTESSALDQ